MKCVDRKVFKLKLEELSIRYYAPLNKKKCYIRLEYEP